MNEIRLKKYLKRHNLLKRYNLKKHARETNKIPFSKGVRKFNLIIKFIRKGDGHFVSRFMNKGEFHFEPIENFHKDNGKINDYLIKDVYEAQRILEFNDPNNFKVTVDDMVLDSNEISYLGLNVRKYNCPISCFVKLTSSDLYEVGDGKFRLKRSIVDELYKSFSSKYYVPFLIFNMHAIILKIQTLLPDNNVVYGCPIHYYVSQDNAINELKEDGTFGNDELFLSQFTKRIYYSIQKEYRLLLKNNSGLNGNNNIEIGNMKNYALRIENLYDFASHTIHVERNMTEHVNDFTSWLFLEHFKCFFTSDLAAFNLSKHGIKVEYSNS